jgi:hypothetical protein
MLSRSIAALSLCVLLGAVSCKSETTPKDVPPPLPGANKPAVLDPFPEVPAVPVKITATGFEPATIPAKKGEKIALAFTRTEEMTCATEAIFDDLGGLEAKLPLNETVRVSFVVPKSGDMVFGCSMQRMIRGKIVATEG